MAFGDNSSFGGADNYSSFTGNARQGGMGLNYNQGFGSRNSGFVADTGLAGALGNGYTMQQIGAQGEQARRLAGLNNAAQTQQAQIAADASKFPSQIKDQHFQQLLPLLNGELGSLQNGALARAGGQSPASPEISVGGVLNDQQIQQQVNASRAGTDATTANQQVQDQRSLAGRGFGANSPLLQMLQAGRQMSGNQQNSANETNLRLNAAQQNAQHVLGTQQARENQFATRQQEDIARRAPVFGQQNALIAALSGLA